MTVFIVISLNGSTLRSYDPERLKLGFVNGEYSYIFIRLYLNSLEHRMIYFVLSFLPADRPMSGPTRSPGKLKLIPFRVGGKGLRSSDVFCQF